ncbi:melanoma cell adhesion molecule b [Aplochiton taeniatus]
MAIPSPTSLLVRLPFILSLFTGGWASVNVSMEGRVEVFRGETAQISCMFSSTEGIGGLEFHWFYVTPTNVKQRIYSQQSVYHMVEQRTPFTSRINVTGPGADRELVLTVRDVQVQDELEFICHVKEITGESYQGSTLLKVFETPETPSIDKVTTGISVNSENPTKIGSCEIKNGYPRPNVTWYRDNTPLQNLPNEVAVVSLVTTESTGLFSVTSILNIKLVKEDKDAKFYCEFTFYVPGGTKMTETNRININVQYPATALEVWVEPKDQLIIEGNTVAIHCHSNGNPQPPFTFKHRDNEMKASEQNILVLSAVTRSDGGVYSCSFLDVIDTYEEIANETQFTVHYLDPAELIPEDDHVMLQGDELKATCNALSSLQTHTLWFKNGDQVAEGHTLTLKDVGYDTAGTYDCVVTVPQLEVLKTSRTLKVLVQGPPEITEPVNTAIEETVENTVNLSCHAQGYPAPIITWTTTDAQVLRSVSHIVTEQGVHSVVSVKVTSDITAFCNASNDLGTDSLAFSIKAIKTVSDGPLKKVKKEGSGVIIAVLIICILLLAILGSVLYFLYKKGKIPCGRSGKQDITKSSSTKDNIVVEMKSDNTEEAVLLGVNGDKKPANQQYGEVGEVSVDPMKTEVVKDCSSIDPASSSMFHQ